MTNNALDIIATFDRDLARSGALEGTHARDLEDLHDAYFGPTKFTAKQRAARDKARAGRFSLDRLVAIERRLRKITDASERWELRLRLLGIRGSLARLKAEAKKIVPADDTPPSPGVRFTRSRHQMRTMTVTANERDLADLERELANAIDTTKPRGPQLADAFLSLIRSDSDAAGGIHRAVPEPLILVPLHAHTRIIDGGGEEVTLVLTDGTRISGADYLNQFIAGQLGPLKAALFHPSEGAVNLYDADRFANDKQRTLLRATSPMCPVPDCRRSADHCQYHHITAWKHGGHTNMNNLSVLCPYHNQVNDDDPGFSYRGSIHHDQGDKVWVSPGGYPVQHDFNAEWGAMSQLFGPRSYDGGVLPG
ncbi:HNH endonuclease [Corynebacterium aquatimens]